MDTLSSSDTSNSPLVSEAQRKLYHQEGYMILERVIPPDMLQMLREECHYFVGYQDGQMDAQGQKQAGITHRGSRYFIGNQYHRSHRLWRFIYSDLMAQICRETLGPTAYLFNEQWVVKGPDAGMKFAWHQDSGYVKFRMKQTQHRPYLSAWCALDDMTAANGTVSILPHSRGGTQSTIYNHTQEAKTNDLIGYTGSDPGIKAVCPAGSIVAFTSYTLHRSGANTMPDMRRVYLAQYSGEPILNQEGGLWAQAIPFVKEGENVYDHQADVAGRGAQA